jgi:hypothetical protein
MTKTILRVLGAALLIASTAQLAVAGEHHHARKVVRAPVSEQFRNANNTIVTPAQPSWYSGYSDYTEGHINMVGH